MRGPRPAPYLLYQRRRRGIRGRAPATRGPDGRARTPESPGPEPHAEVPARCASTGRRTVPHRGGDRWEVVENGLPPRKNPSSTRVLPARAGMVPGRYRIAGTARRAPRTRGDGPEPVPAPAEPVPCSPHARGWSRAPGFRRAGRLVLPARAGMVPALRALRTSPSRAPRTRGDGPVPRPRLSPIATCSPHARGWSPGVQVERCVTAVLPARAGFLLRSDAEVVGAADYGSVGLPLLVDDQDGGG